MELVLAFIGCSVVGFSLTYWSDIKNSIQGKLSKTVGTSKPTQVKTLKGVFGKSLREEYYEAYEYLAKEFGVRTNVLLETTDKDYRVRFVKGCLINQPKCLIPAKMYSDEEFMKHFITIANLYKENEGDELLKKYLKPTQEERSDKIKTELQSLGIYFHRGGSY